MAQCDVLKAQVANLLDKEAQRVQRRKDADNRGKARRVLRSRKKLVRLLRQRLGINLPLESALPGISTSAHLTVCGLKFYAEAERKYLIATGIHAGTAHWRTPYEYSETIYGKSDLTRFHVFNPNAPPLPEGYFDPEY